MARTTRRRRGGVVGLVAGLALIASVAGCSSGTGETIQPSSTTSAPDPGETLVIGIGAEGPGWNPATDRWSPAQLQVARSVYDRLAVYDAGYRLEPQLATAITPNDDFTQWTVAIRPGISFSDGTPLDAGAVAANLEAQRGSPVFGPLFRPVTAVEVLDAHSVRLTMSAPWSTFAHVLAGQPGFIAAPATLSSPPGSPPIGSGPFTFEGSVPGQAVRLVRNPSYWLGPPELAAVELQVIQGGSARADALETGRIDVGLFEEPATIAALRAQAQASDGELQLVLDRESEAPKLTIVLDTAQAPFIDVDARTAVDAATDRQAWWDAGSDGVLRPALGPAADESVWFQGDPLPIRDLGSARAAAQRYAERYGAPLSFTLLVPTDPTSTRMATLWRAQLAEAGIAVELVPLGAAEVRSRAEVGDFQAAMLPMFGTWHPDFWFPSLHRADMTNPGDPGPNYARFGSVDIDEALEAARASDDLAVQVDRFRAVQTAVNDSGAYLFAVRLAQAVAAGAEVEDLTAWTTAAGSPGLPSEGGTVSLTDIRLR